MKRASIVLLGDSITQLGFSKNGWAAHVADVYQRRADVVNRGYSGYNTDWFLQFVSTVEGKHDVFSCVGNDDNDSVKLVIIWFGANDASDSQWNPRQHVPLDRYRSNLIRIISLCRTHYPPECRILLVSPPPIDHTQRLDYQIQRYGKDMATGQLERTLELSGLYADAASQVAADDEGVAFFHVWKEMQESDTNSSWSKYLSDGLHLSEEGNEFVGKRILQIVSKSFPELAVIPCPDTGNTGTSTSISDLIQVGRWHDDIDHLNAERSFVNPKECAKSDN